MCGRRPPITIPTTGTMTMIDPTPTRRRFQFSLRTLLVVVTLCAIPCSWLAVKRQEAWRIRKENERQEKILGDIIKLTRWDVSAGWPHTDEPGWLPRLLWGETCKCDIIIFESDGAQVTDAVLEKLRGLGQLKRLSLARTQLTDDGLKYLIGLKQLRVLDLNHTQVTDAGLKYVSELNQLQELSLVGTKVTDAGVTKLQQALPNCDIRR